jgi:hypothetical protein
MAISHGDAPHYFPEIDSRMNLGNNCRQFLKDVLKDDSEKHLLLRSATIELSDTENSALVATS